MKKNRVYTALMLTFVFLSLSVMPSFAADMQAAYAKLSDDLLEAYSEKGNGERIDVVVWLEDNSIDEYQAITASIPEPVFDNTDSETETYDLLSASTLSEEERLAQIEAMQNYIMQKRQIAQAVYLEDNTAIANQLEWSIDGGEVIYISKYSPLIICSLSQSEAVDVALSNSVLSITNGEIKGKDCMDVSVPVVGANALEQGGYDASGIKIGMLETYYPDTSLDCFSGIADKIVINSYFSKEGVDQHKLRHPSLVAAILVGDDNAIAKNCEALYMAAIGETPSKTTIAEEASAKIEDFIIGTEWLLDNGVNVINYSWGLQLGNTYHLDYNTYANWLDHIAYNHSVHCVVACGNEGAGNPRNTAMAYNVITVGAIYDNSTTDFADDTLASFSSYNDNINSTFAYKPDICAPGVTISAGGVTIGDTDAINSGTSFAAPHVAAIVAVLCSHKPELMTKQALVKSILLTSVSQASPHRYGTNTSSGLSNYLKYGAGIVNAANAIKLADCSNNYANGSITASETADPHPIGRVEVGQKVTVTLAFLKRARFTSSNHLDPSDIVQSDLANLDIYIYNNLDMSVFKYSTTTNNNVEKIIFTALETSEYTIEVRKVTGQGSYEVLYGLSWLIDGDKGTQ